MAKDHLSLLSLSLSLLCSFGLHKWFGKVYDLTPCLVTPESNGAKSIMHIVYDYDPQLAPIESPLCNAIGCVNLFYKAWASLLLGHYQWQSIFFSYVLIWQVFNSSSSFMSMPNLT
jgi:hypothetical protein